MKQNLTRLLIALLLFSTHAIAHQPTFYGREGMIVAHDQEAVEAGLEILKKGGNAVDAAVAVAYALAVTHPQAGNIGGGGFMLIKMADGRQIAIDYRETAPAKSLRDMYLDENGDVIPYKSVFGGLAVGVPGTVAGMQMALDEYGTLSRKKVMKPAIKLAQKGFKVSYQLSRNLEYLYNVTESFPETRRVFANNGNFSKPGDRFIQADLAKTLKLISKHGNKGFYEGPVAEAVVSTILDFKGIMTLDDLKNYKAMNRTPVLGTYKGYEIMSMPPPSSGGIALIGILNLLEDEGLDTLFWHSSAAIQKIVEAERLVYADRSEWLGDPDFIDVPINEMISKEYAGRRKELNDLSTYHSSESVSPWTASEMDSLKRYFKESEETTHFSVVDKWGNAVSNTYTLNWTFGSRVTVKGYGFLLNDEMDDFSAKPGVPNMFGLVGNIANAIEPNKRMLSSMTPTIVMKEGKVVSVLGSPGGSTIITSVLQLILNTIDYKMPPVLAISSPRFHHQWLPDVVYYEPFGLSQETIQSLENQGYEFEIRSWIGESNAIFYDPIYGGWIGVPDPRRGAHAGGY
jgi:gamma-glutamyltranspeptidase / glutathione hydrolase